MRGREATLFREALGVLTDFVRDDEKGDLCQFGISAFDSLQRSQRLAVLAEVGTALLREEAPAPTLTAVREATVAVVYELVRDMMQLEIDDSQAAGGRPTWRELVLGACRQRSVEEDSLPSQDCDDLEEWDLLIQCLADGVLWDDDWKGEEVHLDADPKASRAMKKLFGIDKDYYVDVPPDPSEAELEKIIHTLRELTRG
ncbi:hypothetical protein ACFL5Q_01970 [Planctomycetota bacterium]